MGGLSSRGIGYWHHTVTNSISSSSVSWRALLGVGRFRFLWLGMFVSLFGTGMNHAGVTWYILEQTHSTVAVSLMVVLVTLPGLVVPLIGGVLIDRVDRRYLAITLDVARGVIVLGVAALARTPHFNLATLYAMVLLVGMGFAIYWATSAALVQEIIPREHLVQANAAVLIAVQGGMMSAGAVVGFIYTRAGISGILGIDGLTYLVSALCLWSLRHGYRMPQRIGQEPPIVEAAAPVLGEAVMPPVEEAGTLPPEGVIGRFLAELREGLAYLRAQPRIFAIGLTYACMMAGVISANVIVVALASDILDAGPRGYGYIEAGWATGAVLGGLASSTLVRRFSAATIAILALAMLAFGHALFPFVTVLAAAVVMNAVFGACRALGGIVTQSSIMSAVPQRLMGRTQSAFSTLATLLQVVMSFVLGWLAHAASLKVAFLVLGLVYGASVLAAVQARSLARAEESVQPAS